MGDTCDTVGGTLGAYWGLFGHIPDNKVIATSPSATIPADAKPAAKRGF